MRPGRSWSLGKNNILSPLTDQVAPAPCEPRETGGSHKSDNGTDGKHVQSPHFQFIHVHGLQQYVWVAVIIVCL